MKIQILCDNEKSWIIPYAEELLDEMKALNHTVDLVNKHSAVDKGDVLILLSCERIFRKLDLNEYNLVVHESNLPEGKGWSPLTWQLLEGRNRVTISLFNATGQVDAGEIYDQEIIEFSGNELIDEIRAKQGETTIRLVLDFIKKYPDNKGRKQIGDETFYPRRNPNDSKLDVNKSIQEQFNLLRVCDNERYPAFFEYKGNKYVIKVYKQN